MTSFMDGCQALFFSLYLSSLQKSSPIAVAGHKKVILSTLYYGILCCIHTYGAPGTLVEFKRSIFQTFWKDDCCAKFLFFELETSSSGYLLIFFFSLTVISFRKIGQHLYQTFYKGPFEFLVDYKNKKHQRGDHCKISNINVV